MPPTTGNATTPEAAYRRLRLLAIGAQNGWFEYVAGDLSTGRHLLRIDGRLRDLNRDEIIGWVTGVADAHSSPLLAEVPEDVPPLVTIREAAIILGISPDGVDHRLGQGRLYPMYLASSGGGGGRERHLFAAQVRGQAGDANADEAWKEIRAGFPPANRIVDLPDYAGPGDLPLAVAGGRSEQQRRIQTLMIGHGEAWFDYRSADPAANTYTVFVAIPPPGTLFPRVLDGESTMPYTLGHADTHGHPELVAYRAGLG